MSQVGSHHGVEVAALAQLLAHVVDSRLVGLDQRGQLFNFFVLLNAPLLLLVHLVDQSCQLLLQHLLHLLLEGFGVHGAGPLIEGV